MRGKKLAGLHAQSSCSGRRCHPTATSLSDFAKSAVGALTTAGFQSEAGLRLSSSEGIEGLLSSMCILPRRVERCTVLGPKPRGETALPLKPTIMQRNDKCNGIFRA
jgi:hypothetical protein